MSISWKNNCPANLKWTRCCLMNQAGLGAQLQFDLFRPGQVVVKTTTPELPISIKVTVEVTTTLVSSLPMASFAHCHVE